MDRVPTEPGLEWHLVLAGGGHTHALVLRMWAMGGPPAGALITLVSRCSTALYSGMVPGLIAGLHDRRDCEIDLRRLCDRAGVVFVRAEITGLDPARRELRLAGRPALRWDRLSLDVGAITAPAAPAEAVGLAIKPLEPFLAWCEAGAAAGPLTVVGGGPAGVEVALALRARRRSEAAPVTLQLRPGDGLQLGSAAANRRGERMLAAAGIPLRSDPAAEAPVVSPAGPGPAMASPVTIVRCTGSRAPGWLAAAGLPCDPASGRVFTTDSLEVEGHPGLFASGDCGLVRQDPRPPSGVWAVRAAPVLAANLRRCLQLSADRTAGRRSALLRWQPQRRALQLLGDGGALDGIPRALATWGPLALGPARWIWWWKKRIDQRFIARFRVLASMGGAGAAMLCRGCAAKLAADPLASALARLDALRSERVPAAAAVPPSRLEDAAIVGTAADGALLLQSVDGFPALVADPWLNGRLTTLHACSDLWACGARVESAQALVTLPRAAPSLQEDWLLQTLAGVCSVLEPLGATLVGGHTLQQRSEGEDVSLALTVNGRATPDRFWPKGDLRPGDALLLTRAIGSGVLFAAAMAGAAEPEWIDAALTQMDRSQAPLVELLAVHGCRACTDITGFGLLGHLGEMLRAAAQPLRVELTAAAVPVLPGAWQLLEQGFSSSLAPANRGAWAELEAGRVALAAAPGRAEGPLRELLIDPQTCGPLLAALPPDRVESALAALRNAGFHQAEVIGWVAVP